VNSRNQAIFAALAGLLLVAALVTAVLWTLALSRHPSTPAASPATTGGEVRLYAGLPDATRYGHPVIVLTNAAYLTGYCEARRRRRRRPSSRRASAMSFSFSACSGFTPRRARCCQAHFSHVEKANAYQ